MRQAVDGKEPGWLSIKTCLVVDDTDVVRKVARHIFQSFKFDSREADTGQAALDACQAAMPDAILLDWQMPAMGSVNSCRPARPNGRCRRRRQDPVATPNGNGVGRGLAAFASDPANFITGVALPVDGGALLRAGD